MSNITNTQQPEQPSNMAKAIVGFAIYALTMPVLLFLTAGTLDWPMAWVYTALLLASAVGSRLVVWKRFPELLRERARYAEGEGAKSWDRPLVPIVGILGPMIMVVVAGPDHRFGWTTFAPAAAQVVAALVLALGYALGVWAMVVNRFFSAVARIQKERGHYVITAGPYRWLRHPSYAGALLAALAFPVMLDAAWAFVPAPPMIAAVIVRTRLEDRMLVEELAGYREYAAKTRYRLIPGLW